MSSQGIRFYINGDEHKVPSTFPASTSLNDYLRDVAGLKGTKVMCREAGCGCCSVAVTFLPPDSDTLETQSVQSCLTPLYAVDGWQITTVEGLGNHRDGFHPLQKRIAEYNGTQCGYCTPGMVMNMYGLLHQQPNITTQEIEDNFDGNMCRCTGYRSILDTMKSFSEGWDVPGAKSIDIEDLNKKLCPKTGEPCTGENENKGGTTRLELSVSGAKWYRPTSINDLGLILTNSQGQRLKLVFGNTAAGIFKNEDPFEVYVDLHGVKRLYSYEVKSDSILFGAATTLTSFMSKLKANQEGSGFKYFAAVFRHLKVIANVMVRNAGCLAGNLMIKHAHPDFPSDIFTMFEAIGATVEIYDAVKSTFSFVKLLDFLRNVDMTAKVITAIKLPSLSANTVFKSFKITPRWQNAHAYVNAAFRVEAVNKVVQGRPSFVYGGINADTVHAVKTEDYLTGKTLTNDTVQEALRILKDELKPEADPILASPKYRQELSLSLLYKVLLGIVTSSDIKLRSGADYLYRPISTGLQTYQEIKSELPLKKAMPKKTAELQASGEAQFINDIPSYQHELFAAFVLSEHASATIESIDASKALKAPGSVRLLSAKDIPEGGNNSFMINTGIFQTRPEMVFTSEKVSYAGQPIAAILAESQREANAAAKLVEIKYKDIKEPILSLEESIAKGKEYEFDMKMVVGNPDDAFKNVDRVVEGESRMGSQYHFFLETQVSLAVPSEDGIELYPASQFADMSQGVAAAFIGKPNNYINVTVPRIGGGFGGKAFDSMIVSAVATLGAYLTGRPVRMSLDLSTTMKQGGKRCPVLAKYKVGFSNSGDVQVVDIDYYVDCGYLDTSKADIGHHLHYIDMAYHIPNWNIRPHAMMTNKQVMRPVRAPGSVPASFVIESILEHVAKAINMHPIFLKEINLYTREQTDVHGHDMKDCTIRDIWRRLKDTAEVEGRIRQVDTFNQENLWKKKGITMTSCKYGMAYFGNGYTATVSIFARDGTVAVTQGGVEMGQGLYTKVAQGVAHVLGVPMDSIKVRPNQNISSPNSWVTGGSVSSESAMVAAIEAARILKERIAPIREKNENADWKTLCQKCIENKIDLSAKFTNSPDMGKPFFNYFTYCVAVIETEVDILTGESQIRRVDIMNDLGESLNPLIDIGQIEGAFVMGLGCFLSEDIIFDKTGRILNDGTWEYKPPTTKDIPIDWRVYLAPDTPNPNGVRSSKAVGEPPISLAVGGLLANKLAVMAARKDLHNSDEYVASVAPYTVERVQQSVEIAAKNLRL